MKLARRTRLALVAVSTTLLGLLPSEGVALEVPYLAGRVNDLADLIPAATEARIDAELTRFESETGSQVVVLTVPSLEGESLELFTHRVAQTWGLGREEENDGLLFFVARDDRKMRIEVGYGLEGNMTDLQAGRILDEVVRPRFRAGDFGGGIEAAVDAIVTTLEGGEPLPPPRRTERSERHGPGFDTLFFFAMVTLFGSGRLGWVFCPLLAFLFFSLFNSAFGSPYGPIAAALWVLLFVAVRLLAGRGGGGGGDATAWSSRGGWGGFSGGSSGGGFSGGFSGGGGSFGGGGSSSGW